MKNYAPIGLETQLMDVLEGPSEQTQHAAREKIEYAIANVDKIDKINGSKVFNVTVDGDKLRYNLRNTGEYPQEYYYPIKYASIGFKE